MSCTKPRVQIDLSNCRGTCRVCMRKNNSMKELFDTDCEIVDRIQFCTGILFIETPNLPSFICAECLSHLSIAHNFITACIAADEIFQKVDSKVEVKTKIINDTTLEEEIEDLYEEEVEVDDSNKTVGILIEKEPISNVNIVKLPTPEEVVEQSLNFTTHQTIKLKVVCKEKKKTPQKRVKQATKTEQDNATNKEETPLKSVKQATKTEQDKATNKEETPQKRVKQATKTEQDKATKKEETPLKRVKQATKTEQDKATTKEKTPRIRVKRIRFPKVLCNKCNIWFANNHQLIKHHESSHNTSNYVCEVCGKQFVYQSSLSHHIRFHAEPSFECAHCSYATINKWDLIKHMTIHTGEMKYHCNACPRSFRTSSNLYTHIRHKHGKKTFSCDRCDKSFITGHKLRQHLDAHNNGKRYECPVCHSCFLFRYGWKRHLLIHHAVTVPTAKPGRKNTNLI